MRQQPQQQRSIESTERMLLAAEQLLREGGADAVTVDGVIAKAETSTGAFYARFGNRRGLFEAMHERFLNGFGAEMSLVANQAANAATLHEALDVFVGGLFRQVRTHRDTLAFHVLLNAHDSAMRGQGNDATQSLTVALTDVIARYRGSNNPAKISEIADFMVRLLMGLSLEMLLFNSDEVTGRPITPQRWDNEAVAVLLAYLDNRLEAA